MRPTLRGTDREWLGSLDQAVKGCRSSGVPQTAPYSGCSAAVRGMQRGPCPLAEMVVSDTTHLARSRASNSPPFQTRRRCCHQPCQPSLPGDFRYGLSADRIEPRGFRDWLPPPALAVLPQANLAAAIVSASAHNSDSPSASAASLPAPVTTHKASASTYQAASRFPLVSNACSSVMSVRTFLKTPTFVQVLADPVPSASISRT